MMKSRIFVLGAALMGMLSTACGCGGGATAAATIPLTGAMELVLNQLMDRAQLLIQQAQNAGLVLEVQAGAQAIAVIGYVQQVYQNSLDRTSDILGAQQQQAITGIRSVLDDIENHSLANLQTLASRLQGIANTIPLANRFPQVTAYGKLYVSACGPTSVAFSATGNFFDVADPAFTPVLEVGGHTFRPTTSITTGLTFDVPRDTILPSATSQAVRYIPAILRVPYAKRCNLLSTCKEEAVFRFSFIALPPQPGRVVLMTTRRLAHRITQDFTSHEFPQDSSQDDLEILHCQNMTDGWFFDINSARYEFKTIHLEHSLPIIGGRNIQLVQGEPGNDWFDLGNHSTSTAACWKFKTLHKGLGTSGKLYFFIKGRMYRDEATRESHEQSIDMCWGDSRAVIVDSTARWVLKFFEFDGRQIDFGSADSSNPFVRVSAVGNVVTVKTAPF